MTCSVTIKLWEREKEEEAKVTEERRVNKEGGREECESAALPGERAREGRQSTEDRSTNKQIEDQGERGDRKQQ